MNAENLLYRPFLLLILLAPLPLASVIPWTWAGLGAGIGLVVGAWGILVATGRLTPAVPIGRIWLSAGLFSLVALWSALQTAPWVPESWQHPLWREAGAVLNGEVVGGVAVDPYEARSALLRLLSYGGAFWLALHFCRNRRTALFTIYALSVAGVVYATYGLIIQFSGEPMILWWEKLSYRDDLTSTFVNRNSYATYAGLGLICVTTLIARRTLGLFAAVEGRRHRLRVFLNDFAERDWILFLAWVVLATALLLSHSRAGFASTSMGLAAFLMAMVFAPSTPSRASKGLAAVLLIAGVVFFSVSGDALMRRLESTSVESEEIRKELFSLSLRAIEDAPLLGTGFGSFEQVYHLYRGDTRPYRVRSVRAHNTYLENAMELGVPAAVALFVALAGLAWRCLAGVWRRRRDVFFPAAGLGATVLVAAHSTVDFSLQIPAVALTYAVILGLACAQSWGSAAFALRQPP